MDKALVEKIAQLSDLMVSEKEAGQLTADFTASLAVVDELFAIDTTGTAPTYQVNNLENVWREDEVRTEVEFSQAQALANAKRVHNGYFVVERIIDHDA